MKYIELSTLAAPLKKLVFKWEWAVFWEEKAYGNHEWKEKHAPCESRFEARIFAKHRKVREQYGDYIRNVKIKRRLVQSNWDDYNDTFNWNANGNGNGR
jgi:hypothetical protein